MTRNGRPAHADGARRSRAPLHPQGPRGQNGQDPESHRVGQRREALGELRRLGRIEGPVDPGADRRPQPNPGVEELEASGATRFRGPHPTRRWGTVVGSTADALRGGWTDEDNVSRSGKVPAGCPPTAANQLSFAVTTRRHRGFCVRVCPSAVRALTRRALTSTFVPKQGWRWRESNPRPSKHHRAFSERSRRSDLGSPARRRRRRGTPVGKMSPAVGRHGHRVSPTG